MAKSKNRRRQAQHRHHTRPARATREPEPEGPKYEISNDEYLEILRLHFQRRRRQKIAGWTLLIAGPLLAINHFLLHAETVNLLGPLLSPGWQDLVAGFPVAAVVVLVGIILLGQSDEPPPRPRVW